MARQPSRRELHHSFQILTVHHRNFVDVLRRDGFVCFLPGIIDPNWDDMTRECAGFPLAISFTGLPTDLDRQPLPFFLTSTYWCAPASYFEAEGVRGMQLLRTRALLVGAQVARYGTGRPGGCPGNPPTGFAAYHAGRRPDEPARAFATCEDTGSVALEVWAPGCPDARPK